MAVLEEDMRIQWNYLEIEGAKTKYNGHENILLAERIGGFTWFHPTSKHDRNIVESKFTANSISFKFPSEHKINGAAQYGEVQVHHRYGDNKDGDADKAILSILLEADYSGEIATEGTFIDALKLDELRDEDENSPFNFQVNKETPIEYISGEVKPNLEKIVYGGATNYLKKSFYYYLGSETNPLTDCEEGVKHFIMANPVKVPADLLDKLALHTFKREDSPNESGNARKIKDAWMEEAVWDKEEGKRVLFFHKDRTADCEPLTQSDITNAIKEKMEEREEEHDEVLSNLKSGLNTPDGRPLVEELPKFYKTTTKITSFALSHHNPETGELGHGQNIK